jgi:capsule polysaccharide export protein KpsE/RkpR
MSNTVEKTVGTYVQLNDREALENLRTYRQKLAIHLKARTGLDFSLLIHQIDAEITVIEAGLDKLNQAPSA